MRVSGDRSRAELSGARSGRSLAAQRADLVLRDVPAELPAAGRQVAARGVPCVPHRARIRMPVVAPARARQAACSVSAGPRGDRGRLAGARARAPGPLPGRGDELCRGAQSGRCVHAARCHGGVRPRGAGGPGLGRTSDEPSRPCRLSEALFVRMHLFFFRSFF